MCIESMFCRFSKLILSDHILVNYFNDPCRFRNLFDDKNYMRKNYYNIKIILYEFLYKFFAITIC